MEQTVRLLFFLTAQNDITFTMQHKQNLLSYIDQIIIFMSGTYVYYIFLFILMPQLWKRYVALGNFSLGEPCQKLDSSFLCWSLSLCSTSQLQPACV